MTIKADHVSAGSTLKLLRRIEGFYPACPVCLMHREEHDNECDLMWHIRKLQAEVIDA